jgi:hypothetical protein
MIMGVYWKLNCFVTPNNKYQYDSVGLLKEYQYISDYSDKRKINHRFVPDSLLLYQYHYYHYDPDILYYHYTPDTTFCFGIQFKFDKQGKVLEEKAGWSDEIYYWRTIYKYNQAGQPVYLQTMRYGGEEKEEEAGHQDYFYTDGKLDSIVSAWSIVYGGGSEPTKLYYDERGLCYRQNRRGDIIINCIYKQRE